MKKRIFIGSLMVAIPSLLFIIASFWGGEEWEWGTARAVFFLCILPFAVSGFIGATVFENRSTRQIEQKSKSEEKTNPQENADNQRELGERIEEKNDLQETTNYHEESAKPIGAKKNVHGNVDHPQESELSRSIIGGIIGGIAFVVVALIACLIMVYSLGCQNGC